MLLACFPLVPQNIILLVAQPKAIANLAGTETRLKLHSASTACQPIAAAAITAQCLPVSVSPCFYSGEENQLLRKSQCTWFI